MQALQNSLVNPGSRLLTIQYFTQQNFSWEYPSPLPIALINVIFYNSCLIEMNHPPMSDRPYPDSVAYPWLPVGYFKTGQLLEGKPLLTMMQSSRSSPD